LHENLPARRATVHDVARKAGVSLATVDRVLNGRPGVRAETADKVVAAIAALDFSRDLSASLLARARDINMLFLIPGGGNEFMANLVAAIAGEARALSAQRLHLAIETIKPLDAVGLAARLGALDPKSCDCVAIVATEDAAVVAAVDAAARRGITVLTLVSDLPGSRRRAFIGINNIAAGRTAAALLGRFAPAGGSIGVIAGSLGLRDHRERLEGFTAVMQAEFPRLAVIGPLEGHDAPDETARLVTRLIAEHNDLCGLYNLGAGNDGLIAALAESGRAAGIRVVAHELTAATRAGLESGAIDVVLDQNPAGEIRAAIAAARDLVFAAGTRQQPAFDKPIEIGIFLRDNLG
jgi:LacI family transcriptional regulator